jgi:phosphoribosylglycinamide formyltransferase-1
MNPKVRIAIFISGRGSNLRALLQAAAAPDFPASIALVLSNVASATGLAIAAAAGVPVRVIDHKGYPSREAFEREVDAVLAEAAIELVGLAGFMRILSPWLSTRWAGRMISIHPALLPAFPGLDTHARALEAGVKIHGCTVHFVIPELDAGPIIAQAAVPVLDGDTPQRLAARVLVQEHILYPRALRLVAAGEVRLSGGRAMGVTETEPAAALQVPGRP